MLETLTRGFREARDRLKGTTELSEESVRDALAEVRRSLLEADVDLGVVRDFLSRVTDRCTGEQVALRAGKGGQRLRATPDQHFVKSCYDELVELMGKGEPIEPLAKGERRTLMLLGLQGTGKTAAAAKLALHLKRGGESPLLVAGDVHRPAAREQLRVLGDQIGVEVFSREGDDAPAIAREAVEHARANGLGTVILDTAGRLQIDDDLMTELESVAGAAKPDLSILVCDSMMGREAVNVATGFAERISLDGLILTKLDGDSRGGAALAIRSATGVPIRMIATGEAPDRFEPFRAEGLASRILGLGDVVGLMQEFEQVADAEQAEAEAERLLKGQFSLEDFLSQLRTLQKMGPLGELMQKLPMAGELLPEGAQVDPQELRRIEAMILSMTPGERRDPDCIDDSRATRIAKGSGTDRSALGAMLDRFRVMRKMMKQLGKGGGLLGKLPGVGKLMGGDAPDLSSFDPTSMLAGGAPNRRAARAAKAQERRQQRKKKRKHVRRGKRR